MTDLNEVLERLMTDPGFRQQLKDDPALALEGYHLDEGELELLSNQIDEGSGSSGSVEQRTSKSALAGLLGLFGGGGGQGQYQESDLGFVGQHVEHDESGTELEKVSFTYQRIDVEGDSDGPNELAIEDPGSDEALDWELKPAHVTSYSMSAAESGGDEVEMDLHSGQDDAEPPSSSKGKVEYTWKIEEGVKVVDPDGGDLATPETDPEGAEAPGIPKGPFMAESFSFGSSQDSGGLRSDGELVQAVSEESNQDLLVGKVTPTGASASQATEGPSFGDIHGESQGDRSVMEVKGLKMEMDTVELLDVDEATEDGDPSADFNIGMGEPKEYGVSESMDPPATSDPAEVAVEAAESDLGFVGQHLEHDESGAELEKVSLTYQRIEVEADSDGPDEIVMEDSAGSEGDGLGRVKPQFVWDADDDPAAGVEHTDDWDQPGEMAEVGESSEEATMELHEFTLSKSMDKASPSEPGVDGVILINDPSYPASGGFDGDHLVTSARHVVETDVEAVNQGASDEGVVDDGDFLVWRGQTGTEPDEGPGETLGDNRDDAEAEYHAVKMEEVVVTSIQPGDEPPVEVIAGTQDAEPDQPVVIGRVYNSESPPPDEARVVEDEAHAADD